MLRKGPRAVAGFLSRDLRDQRPPTLCGCSGFTSSFAPLAIERLPQLLGDWLVKESAHRPGATLRRALPPLGLSSWAAPAARGLQRSLPQSDAPPAGIAGCKLGNRRAAERFPQKLLGGPGISRPVAWPLALRPGCGGAKKGRAEPPRSADHNRPSAVTTGKVVRIEHQPPHRRFRRARGARCWRRCEVPRECQPPARRAWSHSEYSKAHWRTEPRAGRNPRECMMHWLLAPIDHRASPGDTTRSSGSWLKRRTGKRGTQESRRRCCARGRDARSWLDPALTSCEEVKSSRAPAVGLSKAFRRPEEKAPPRARAIGRRRYVRPVWGKPSRGRKVPGALETRKGRPCDRPEACRQRRLDGEDHAMARPPRRWLVLSER